MVVIKDKKRSEQLQMDSGFCECEVIQKVRQSETVKKYRQF